MQARSKYSKLLFIFGHLIWYVRRLIESCKFRFNIEQPKLKKLGFTQFKSSELAQLSPDSPEFTDAIHLLDQIDKGSKDDPEKYPVSYEGSDYSYEFINKNPFYCAKLGPRLRLTYGINQFEKWPLLAQKIISSKKYVHFLMENYGTTEGVHKCYIEKTFAGGEEPEWHVDSVSEIGRLVFLLNDVSSEDAPLEYIQSSHLDSNPNYSDIKIHHMEFAESWTTYEKYKSDDNMVLFTGSAGDSYFFDARGVHRSSLSKKSKSRYVLMISFTKKNFFNWFFDLNRGGWPAGVRKLNLN